MLEGLLEYEKAHGPTAAVTDARARGDDYLLERRMLRSLTSGEVIDRRWTRFSFPVVWHYDVLRGLDYLRSAGVKPDERVAEAVATGGEAAARERAVAARWHPRRSRRPAVLRRGDRASAAPAAGTRCAALRVLDWYGN